MSKTAKIWLASAVAVLVVVGVVIALVVGGRQDASEESAPVENETSQSDPTFSEAQDTNPGALVGNTQRTWPDPWGGLDDRAHEQPGQYSADMFFNRPVWTPVEHDGDFPDREQLKDGECSGWTELRGTTQQQYVNARYMVVNSEAGPSKAVRGVPRGYANSPQGAAVAAMNTVMFSADGGDEIAAESFEQLWSSSGSAAELRSTMGYDKFRYMAQERFSTVPAPSAFEVVTCTPGFVVVDVAVAADVDSAGEVREFAVFRVPVRWTEGDWVADFSGDGDEKLQRSSTSVSGMVEVAYT